MIAAGAAVVAGGGIAAVELAGNGAAPAPASHRRRLGPGRP